MNKIAMSNIRKQNNPFSIFTVFMLIFGIVKTSVAAIIFVFGIIPIIQGIESFEIGVLIGFLIFSAVGIGLFYIVILQIIKYKKCLYLLKSGNDGKGTYLSNDYILINRQPFYKVKYSFNDENNQHHEVKTRYVYSESEAAALEQMGTIPIKFQGKHSVVIWPYDQSTNDNALSAVDNRITRMRRIVLRLNIIFGITIFVTAFALIMVQNAGEFINKNIVNTAMIIIFVTCIVGGILTNIIAFVIRKILMVKSVVRDIKSAESKSKYF